MKSRLRENLQNIASLKLFADSINQLQTGVIEGPSPLKKYLPDDPNMWKKRLPSLHKKMEDKITFLKPCRKEKINIMSHTDSGLSHCDSNQAKSS